MACMPIAQRHLEPEPLTASYDVHVKKLAADAFFSNPRSAHWGRIQKNILPKYVDTKVKTHKRNRGKPQKQRSVK